MNKRLILAGVLGWICTIPKIGLAAGTVGAAAEEPLFLTGGDISALPKLESLGARYGVGGKTGDVIRIMRDSGCTCFRVRLFVNPLMKEVVVQDLPFAIALSKRIKAVGGTVLLDLHYSDTWADPAQQNTPKAWETLSFFALERQVETYTAGVIQAFKVAGCLPDIVQVGNEITPGILWPQGKINAPEGGWDRLAALLRAGIRGVKKPLTAQERIQIMLHIDCGGDVKRTQWFFDHIVERAVIFDMIGLSYYPWWHGNLASLRENLTQTARRYSKPIVVVETAYPWRKHGETQNMDWPMTHEGQQQFLSDLVGTVRGTTNHLGRGVIWWYPESIRTKGVDVWKGGDVALFDAEGNALPALNAFKLR
jgi:arabinogalactan endo-1,4-beta-galactosidase